MIKKSQPSLCPFFHEWRRLRRRERSRPSQHVHITLSAGTQKSSSILHLIQHFSAIQKKSLPRECYLNLHTLHTHSHNPLFNGFLFKKKILRLSVTKGRATLTTIGISLKKTTICLKERKKKQYSVLLTTCRQHFVR